MRATWTGLIFLIGYFAVSLSYSLFGQSRILAIPLAIAGGIALLLRLWAWNSERRRIRQHFRNLCSAYDDIVERWSKEHDGLPPEEARQMNSDLALMSNDLRSVLFLCGEHYAPRLPKERA
jgi:hypothetical protein